MRRTRGLLFVALPVTLLVAVAGVAFWSAQRTLIRSAADVQTQHQLPYSLRVLDPGAAQARNPGFEPVSSSNAYTCGAFLSGELYLAGPAGLSIFAPNGSLRQSLRTGFELPVSPIIALASGRLRGASDAKVLIATNGGGLLLLEPNLHGQPAIHQLLPDAAEARDLTALLPLASGDLLLGTRHSGVLLFDGSRLTPYAATGSQALQITALAAPDAASVLIGTRNAGLFYVYAGTLQHADAGSGMPDAEVDSILTGKGKVYVGTPLGVAQFDLTSANSFRPERILAPGLFSHALALDPASSELFVGSLDQGIAQISLTARPRLRSAAFSVPEAQTSQRIDQFLATPSSLYALADGALMMRSNSGWHPALAPASAALGDRNISALAFTPDGTLYVGFFDHGLDILKPGEGSAIAHLEDDHLFCVNRLVLDPVRQTMAAATANGLVLFDRQGTPRQVLTRRDGLISDHITDLAFTRTGMTLATPAGLTFLGPSGTESLYAFQGLVNNHVYTLGANGDSMLAGTLGGLSLLEANAVKRNFTASNSGLKHNWITALAPAPNGGWFVGTYGAGIETLSADDSHFAPIELPAGAPRDLVINPNALLVTRSHVFAGTLGHGFLMLDLTANRWSLVTEGLPSLNVTAFAERDGELYVGTENGLVRIAESKFAGGRL